MMKKILLAGALIGTLGGIEVSKVNASYHQASAAYGRAEYFRIGNKFNRYMVYFQWLKPTAKRDGRIVVGLPEPCFWQGFPARGFSTLTVNGIGSDTIEPKAFRTFGDAAAAGVEISYNFDGVKMLQRFYMTEKSPLLYMEWRKDPGCTEKIDKMELSLAVYPSYSIPNGGKYDERYRREIRTADGVITVPQKTAWKTLKTTDSALDLYDATFDYPGTGKAQGPCFLTFDPAGVRTARVWFGKIYVMDFRFTLDPKAGKWRFGLFEFRKPMSNAEYFEYRGKHDFSLPEKI